MPTIITHGLVGLALAARVKTPNELARRRLLVAAVICAMLPDADFIGFKLSVQYSSLFGHRGFTHGLLFAAIVAAIATWFLNRKTKSTRSGLAGNFLLLFLATASHGFFDAMTDGGEGIAFFSPFSNHRYFFFYRPIMVSPLGVESFFSGWRGLTILADEFLLVLVPTCLLLYARELWSLAKKKKAAALACVAAWIACLFVLNGLSPLNNLTMPITGSGHPVVDLYAKQYNSAHVTDYIPKAGLSTGRFVTNFLEFQKLGLYNRMMESDDLSKHWASGFSPNWFGGIAGRWQDSNLKLLLRTIFGYGVVSSQEIQEVLKESMSNPSKQDFLFRMSPAEKYDLALGDYSFAATRSILSITHNATELPKFWYGICNGFASASKWYEEPFRAVDVINPNGFKIRFHPNDVKILLGYALANAQYWTEIGVRCNVNGPEARGCRINPGAFFLSTMNRLGLAHDGFIVDGFSGTRKQFYLLDAARVEMLQRPAPVASFPGWTVPPAVKSLAKVRFTLQLVSTLLGDKEGAPGEDSGKGEGYFKKVGRIIVPRTLEAALALDKDGEVIGGAWLGDEDVPDVIFFPSPTPAVDKNDKLTANTAFSWPQIKQIYQQSVRETLYLEPLDFSQ
jgi:inner membrane protein